MTNLNLTVPMQGYTHIDFDTRPRKVKKWIEELPYANLATCASHLNDALFSLNRYPIKVLQRFDLMEMFCEPYSRVSDNHMHMHCRRTYLLKNMRENAELMKKLATEMAHGYKIIVNSRAAASSAPQTDDVLILSLQRSMKYQSAILLNCFITYLPHPGNSWRELHHLYAYAEENGILDIPISDHSESEDESTTIGETYKRIMLTSLVDPYSLGGNEICSVFQYLRNRADRAGITPMEPVSNPAGYFVIDPERDAGAYPLGAIEGSEFNDRLHLMNTRKLAVMTRDNLVAVRGNPSTEITGIDMPVNRQEVEHLLGRMVSAWGKTRKRRFQRFQHRDSIQAVFGIDDIHFLIRGDTRFRMEDNLRNETVLTGNLIQQSWTNFKMNNRSPAQSRCDVINESAGGLALSMNLEPELNLGVGQLIGILHDDSSDTQLSIGIVRRLHTCRQDRLELGIQHLSPDVTPVILRATMGSGVETEFRLVLLMVETLDSGTRQSLISPRGMYSRNRAYTMHTGDKLMEIRGQGFIESTGYLDHFQFTIE